MTQQRLNSKQEHKPTEPQSAVLLIMLTSKVDVFYSVLRDYHMRRFQLSLRILKANVELNCADDKREMRSFRGREREEEGGFNMDLKPSQTFFVVVFGSSDHDINKMSSLLLL